MHNLGKQVSVDKRLPLRSPAFVRLLAPEFFLPQPVFVLILGYERFESKLTGELEGEVAAFRDTLQQLYTDDWNGDGRLTHQGLSVMSGMLGKAEMDKIGAVNLIRLGLTSSRKKTLENFETYISVANNELANRIMRNQVRLNRFWQKTTINRQSIIISLIYLQMLRLFTACGIL